MNIKEVQNRIFGNDVAAVSSLAPPPNLDNNEAPKMTKSQIVARLQADIEKNGDAPAPERLITALDSRPWIKRELIAVLEYAVILAILAGILT